ncbi:regulator of telomere elongation helicase 1 homolog isoform X2 [Tasmannia lanceolata]|uniref:regulator of telomere elongation helicase 1 homolog isoform X2 n=1 Tax=Tasmannia lanceolata TaxID=3420 RepID=UPI004063A045
MILLTLKTWSILEEPRGRNRGSLSGIQWENTVLIFDEAHNLESICADAASFDLPASHLAACISEANQCVGLSLARRAIEKSDDRSLDPDNFAILKALLQKLEKRIAEVPVESKELGFTRPGPYIYELFADLHITHETANMLIDTIDHAALLLEDAANAIENRLPHKKKGTVCRLETMRDVLRIIFGGGDKGHAKFYRVHVQESQEKFNDAFKGKVSRMLSWWCFSPGIAMREFLRLGVCSIILTSGTLSPLDSFALELNLEFPIRLENPHVISSNQVWVGVVPTGPSGCSFNSSYRNRDSLEYKQELGNAIVNFARIVPDGLLVFFPSYYLLDQCIECWKNTSHASSTNSSTIWERICKHKQPVVEPKQSALFSHSIEDFQTKLKDTSTSGAIFLAVCRGKVSEGLDFADHAGRAVVITGMPFAMKTDPKIRLKREYLDQQALSQKKECKVLTGEEWYSQQAARAVNQAVGRVIRHRHDYGAIIFCDERFDNRQSQMSLWLRPHVKSYPKFGDVVFTLTRFFRERGACPIKTKMTESVHIEGSDSIRALEPSENEGMHEPLGSSPQSVSALPKFHENDRELKIGELHKKMFSAKACNHMTAEAEDISKTPLSTMLAYNRDKTCTLLGEIVPANLSTLSSNRQNHTLKHSRDIFSGKNRLETLNGKKKDPQHRVFEVVDLTGNSPLEEQPITEDTIKSCSSKKYKMLKSDPEATQYSENYASYEHLCNVESAHLQSNISFLSTAHKHCKEVSQLPPYGATPISVNDNDRMTANPEHNSGISSQKAAVGCLVRNEIPCGDDETRGSAFLMQVQEKLTTEEYKEFVGLMKALKSKTMKIIPVLESIARLFSSPERLVLLRRFKDYMPAKYRPLYEQNLKSL